jgi:sodium transport system permease protein
MTPFAQAMVVFRKEVKDAFRDRRALYSIAIGALMGPLMMWFTLSSVAGRQRQIEEVRIPVVGMEHAPALMDWLRQQAGVEVVAFTADGENGADLQDAEAAVRDRKEDVVVVIGDDFGKKFRASSPAPVKIVADASRQATRPKVQRVRGLFTQYSGQIGTMRLIGRGVSPAIATAVQVEDVEVSSGQQRAATILGFIPMFIVLAAFMGGMQIATDSTAGERERGSLEPLLVNPAPRGSIAAGKWMAATFASVLSVLLTATLVLGMMSYIPLHDLGIRFRLGPPVVIGLLLAVLPMSLLSTAFQTYLATFAKSFKEAQTYMGILILVPMLPGIITSVYPIATQIWMYPIPILGQHVLMSDVLGGKPTPWWAFVLGAGAALITALLLVQVTTRLLQREKIIFSR